MGVKFLNRVHATAITVGINLSHMMLLANHHFEPV